MDGCLCPSHRVLHRDVCSRQDGPELIQVGAQASQRTPVERGIRWLEVDPESTIPFTSQRPREMRKGAQQIVQIVGIGIVAGDTVSEPRLRIVGRRRRRGWGQSGAVNA
jgi:hypothetical protein